MARTNKTIVAERNDEEPAVARCLVGAEQWKIPWQKKKQRGGGLAQKNSLVKREAKRADGLAHKNLSAKREAERAQVKTPWNI
jgi:hypothetical protein